MLTALTVNYRQEESSREVWGRPGRIKKVLKSRSAQR